MENPKKLWFQRKLYGWGWTPMTWQGRALTAFYGACIILLALTIDEKSGPREVIFTLLLPLCLITATFIRILYKKGEKSRWQWGKDLGDE